MTEEVIEYTSNAKLSTKLSEKRLETSSLGGLNWRWNFFTDFTWSPSTGKLEKFAFLKWKFDWSELKKQGVEGFVGEMTFSYENKEYTSHTFPIKLLHHDKWIFKRLGTLDATRFKTPEERWFKFEFSLQKIHRNAELAANVGIQIPQRFLDSVLVVAGRKINVNKNYLSMRSEFFEALFKSNSTEESMAEIPIEDVKYEDFQCLLDAIHPTNPTPPTGQTARILLKLADRFMMPAVTSQVETHLLTFSDLPFFQTLLLADDFSLNYLLAHCVDQLKTLETIGLLKKRPEPFELSNYTKAKLFDNALPFFN